MTTATFQEAKRVQRGVLATAEKRALRWLAERMPPVINSDHLTGLGFVAMILAGVFYALSGKYGGVWIHAVNACLLVNWFGDSLDGTLARYRNRQRPRYGFYVDHILDTFSFLFIVGGLGVAGFLSFPVAAALLITYYMLNIHVYLATYTMGEFKISFAGLSPTELRLLLVVGNLFVLTHSKVTLAGKKFLLFDIGGTLAAIMMAGFLVFATIRSIAVLYREEKIG